MHTEHQQTSDATTLPGERGMQDRIGGAAAGFTVIEATVTLAMIAILSGVFTVGIISTRKNAAVRNGAQQLAGHIAQTVALAHNGVKDPECEPPSDPLCSEYVVSFSGGDAAYSRTTANTSGQTVTFHLPAGVRFAEPSAHELHVAYRPPLVNVTSPTLPIPAPIVLEHVSPSATKMTVCVAGGGITEIRIGALETCAR